MQRTSAKKLKIVGWIVAIAIILTVAGFVIHAVLTDPFSPSSPNYYYKDRIVYPLEGVDINDDSEYMIVKWQHSPEEKYEVVTDTKMIKDNISAFSIDNDGTIYGTTADGVITLYKDGEEVGYELFDNTYTRKIEYGTLQFTKIDESQLELLLDESKKEN